MNFRKRKEIIIWPREISTFILKTFDYSDVQPDKDIINAFIKSPFYIWQEMRHDNVDVNIDGRATTTDWNFHGLYKVDMLSFSDYQKTNVDNFKKHFNESMLQEIGEDELVNEIKESLDLCCQPNLIYYLLNVEDKSKIHQWTAYEFFYSGIIVNADNKILTVVEFGMD